MTPDLAAPYPYFGGKSKIAADIWQRIGDVPNFVDPFFGSGSILLKRPTEHPYLERIETVNDKDGMISNFWRALQSEPDTVAKHADWPVNENDLHARHLWLVDQKFNTAFIARLEGDPGFYDVKIAGWWVWGMALWIGGSFCSGDGPWQSVNGELTKTDSAGRGVQRRRVHLSSAGQGIQANSYDLYAYFGALSARLRRVRVCSGDWQRVLGPAVTVKNGLTGIMLDPPYTHDGRDTEIYNHDHVDIAAQVRQWAIEHGDDPLLRIAYCGYEDGYQWPEGWTALKWKANKGYGGLRKDGTENLNREREVVWFSPHCLKVVTQLSLWETSR